MGVNLIPTYCWNQFTLRFSFVANLFGGVNPGRCLSESYPRGNDLFKQWLQKQIQGHS